LEADDMINVFVSYCREDKTIAENLFSKLQSNPLFNPWIDFDSLTPGQNWKNSIKTAIQKADLFIAMFSRNSINKRGFVQKEIKEALEVLEEIPENQIYFIPIRLDECEIPFHKINELHHYDIFPDIK
jgi:hypothetical protein